MKISKFFAVIALTLTLMQTYVSADTYNSSSSSKGELVYTPGFYTSVGDVLGAGAYFGQNNSFNAFLGVEALFQVIQLFPQTKRNTLKETSFLAGGTHFVPILRQSQNNRLFLLNNVTWTQGFGKGFSGIGKWAGNWQIEWFTGFQFRLTSSVYISYSSIMLSYNKIDYKNPNVPSSTTNVQNAALNWDLFGSYGQFNIHVKF